MADEKAGANSGAQNDAEDKAANPGADDNKAGDQKQADDKSSKQTGRLRPPALGSEVVRV